MTDLEYIRDFVSRAQRPDEVYVGWEADSADADVGILTLTRGLNLAAVEPEARWVWIYRAASYNEAMQAWHTRNGWEPYRPMEDAT